MIKLERIDMTKVMVYSILQKYIFIENLFKLKLKKKSKKKAKNQRMILGIVVVYLYVYHGLFNAVGGGSYRK